MTYIVVIAEKKTFEECERNDSLGNNIAFKDADLALEKYLTTKWMDWGLLQKKNPSLIKSYSICSVRCPSENRLGGVRAPRHPLYTRTILINYIIVAQVRRVPGSSHVIYLIAQHATQHNNNTRVTVTLVLRQ